MAIHVGLTAASGAVFQLFPIDGRLKEQLQELDVEVWCWLDANEIGGKDSCDGCQFDEERLANRAAGPGYQDVAGGEFILVDIVGRNVATGNGIPIHLIVLDVSDPKEADVLDRGVGRGGIAVNVSCC